MSSKTILVVDDEEPFRLALKSLLEKRGYRVLLCDGGKSAQSLFMVETVDVVITDIRMPQGNGLELLHFVKRTKKVPVVLMTGFAELAETQEAHSLGADWFLPKPFKTEDLLTALESAGVAIAPQKRPARTDEDFCKLGIADFVTGKEMQFDIYIRLGTDKFVKIAHQGADIPADQIQAFKSKGIRFLYMLKSDFQRYVGFNITVARALNHNPQIDKAKKLNFVKHTGEVIMEQLHSSEIDEDSFECTKAMIETTVLAMTDSPDMLDLLTVLNSHSDALYAHSLGVSFYATLLARALKWTSPITHFKIAMGGLLHDIGKKEIDRTVLDKSRKSLTAEEVRLLETHPTRGRDILAEVQSVPDDVLQIVLQHHEDCQGQGFPMGLRHRHIHPLARLVSVANVFCNFAIKGPQSEGMPPKEAVNRTLSLYRGALDPVFVEALLRVFKMNAAPDRKSA